MQLKLTLKKLNLQKIFKERVINIYLENYERFKWENLVVYHVSRFYIKNKKQLTVYLLILCLCIHHPLHPVFHFISSLISLISPCHRSQITICYLPTPYISNTSFDVCNQLYSLSLTILGPTTQNNLPWLDGSKLHSKLCL